MQSRLWRGSLVSVALVLLGGHAMADESCADIIALSKTNSTEVSDESEVSANARNFCGAYSKHHNDSTGWSYGAEYSFLSATMGGNRSSADDVASRYCDAGNSYQARADVYKKYVELIAPGAFSAYRACITQQSDITFQKEGWTPNEFTLRYHYIGATTGAQPTNMIFAPSKGVSCAWSDTKSNTQVTRPGGSGLLMCSRADASKPGFVTISRTNGPGDINIQLQPFDKDGHPIDAMKDLMQSVRTLRETIALNSLPNGSVIPWLVANTEPPKGWVKCDGTDPRCPNLKNLFVRGSDAAGVNVVTGDDAVKLPFMGSNESDPDGNGWSKDGQHFVPRNRPSITVVPRHITALYIMKIANN